MPHAGRLVFCLALAPFLAGCQAPLAPATGVPEVALMIRGRVTTYIGGVPVPDASVVLATLRPAGGFDLEWSPIEGTGVRTDRDGVYAIAWTVICPPGSTTRLFVVVEGLDSRPVQCTADPQTIDVIIHRDLSSPSPPSPP